MKNGAKEEKPEKALIKELLEDSKNEEQEQSGQIEKTPS